MFIHSLDDVREFVFMISRGSLIASHPMKINIRMDNIDTIDPMDEIRFHVVYASG